MIHLKLTPSNDRRLIILLFVLSVNFLFARTGDLPYDKKELISELLKINDDRIFNSLNTQWTNKKDTYYGSAFDKDSVVSPGRTAGLIQTFMCGFVSPQSKYYQSEEILFRMTIASQGLLNMQHEDGTIDLLSTNFHSTPDLGFTIYPLGMAYSIMLKNDHIDFKEFPANLKQFLLNAGKALSVGGIHTPNHRWVVSGALAWLYSFFPNPEYRLRVDQWLAERIDIDPDGQYHERSTSVYTPITNRSLLEIAKRMGYEDLYDHVRKNLDMTFYFVHSNGEIVTESSKRQDKYKRSNMHRYYLAYNYLALYDNNQHYAGMVNYIEKTVPISNLIYMLPYLLEDSFLHQKVPKGISISKDYHKYFKHSDMVRIKKENVDMSIITDNHTFFTYFKGEAALEAVRLSAAFFGKGQFLSQHMEKKGDTYILSSTIEAPYYQPLSKDQIPAEGEAWGQVSRIHREQSEIQTLSTKIYITENNGKATIKIVVDGPKNLPVTLELGFRDGGILSNVNSKLPTDQAHLIKTNEYAIYKNGSDSLKIGPGIAKHKWTQLRGALPKLEANCLYFTNYAPCEIEFTIE